MATMRRLTRWYWTHVYRNHVHLFSNRSNGCRRCGQPWANTMRTMWD